MPSNASGIQYSWGHFHGGTWTNTVQVNNNSKYEVPQALCVDNRQLLPIELQSSPLPKKRVLTLVSYKEIGSLPEDLPAEPSLTKLLSKKKTKALQPPPTQ